MGFPAFSGVDDLRSHYASYETSVDVKRILRKKIYEKLLKLGASYRESAATSEVVQMTAEGVEQLETYFGKYLPQLFYSILAPVTLFSGESAGADHLKNLSGGCRQSG